jgi:hypothetical protein
MVCVRVGLNLAEVFVSLNESGLVGLVHLLLFGKRCLLSCNCLVDVLSFDPAVSLFQTRRSKASMELASKSFKKASDALLSHGRSIPYQLWNNWGVVEHRFVPSQFLACPTD